MIRKFAALIFAGLILMTTGCQRPSQSARVSSSAQPYPSASKTVTLDAAAPASGLRSFNAITASAATTERFVAESHKLDIIASESQLQKSWDSAVAFCGTIQCEVVSSSITSRTNESEPSGVISLRVAPGDLKKLLDYVQKLGTVAQHTTEREDKTTEVIDTEAKIKNLTTFRDNLRAMLSKPSATVKDLIDIQQQLSDTQAQLDSEAAQRKVLANETDKVAVEISFRVEGVASTGGLGAIWNALRESGSMLADSIAALITFIVVLIPWLILIIPATWLLIKAWRKLRRKRSTSAQSSSPAT